GSGLWVCRPAPRCGDQIYNPSQHCCYYGTILTMNQTRPCGPNCTFWPCFELCCSEYIGFQKKYVVRLKVQGLKSQCFTSPVSSNCKKKRTTSHWP
uniref:IGF like family member 3 n=1 Tax=Loxodonta africana TaxID=9785 RepID=G3TZ10_LOXAF